MIFPGRVKFGSRALGDVPYYEATNPAWTTLSQDPISVVSDLPVSGNRLPVLPDGSTDWRYVVPGLSVAPDAQGRAVYTMAQQSAASSFLADNKVLLIGGAGLVLLAVVMRRR